VSIGVGHGPVKAEPEEPERPGKSEKKWRLILGCLVVAFVLLAAYDLISGGAESNGIAAPARTHPIAVSPSAAAHTTPYPDASTSPAASLAQRPLAVATIAAFGPAGTSDGDNPGIVSRVVHAGAQPWYSLWYASPQFGNLQSGTGLLLDMGETVTVTDVRLILGQAMGADVQLRVGDSASLADLPPVASASGVSGTVRLAAATPAQGRFVLLWFTRLPPDGQGHYQVSVYSVSVDG
jgi:hypothetical protein